MVELIFHALEDIFQKTFIKNVVKNMFLKSMIYI